MPGASTFAGSQVFHPVEMLIFTALQIFATMIVIGLDPLAGAIIDIGRVLHDVPALEREDAAVARLHHPTPKSHCIHHRLGLHYYNFADLPLWTSCSELSAIPKRSLAPVGFDGGADVKLGAMLAFADVNAPLYGPGSRGQQPRREAVPQAA